MATTLKDIARQTNLSVPSVCLILNGQGHKFREETRKLVFEVASQLKYRPDTIMRRMGRASARRDAIGFLVRSEGHGRQGDPPVHEYLCGVNDYLLQRDQLMVMAKLDSIVERPGQRPPRLIAERFIDGLLLVETGLPEEVERLVEHYEIMTVWLNTQRRSATDCIYPDNHHSGYAATRHLIELGHKSIAFLPNIWISEDQKILQRYSSVQRHAGYLQAMSEARLAPMSASLDELQPDRLSHWVKTLVERRYTDTPVTGIVSASFGPAIKLLELLLNVGLRVPHDLSLVSAGDLHMLHSAWPQITRVACDRYAMGQFAAETILTKIAQGGQPQASRAFAGELIKGSTSAQLN